MEDNEDIETFERYVCETGQKHPEEVCIASSLAFSQTQRFPIEEAHPKLVSHLSGLQIQAVGLINQRHKTSLPNGKKAGFLLGDGTGMGKTRVIVATILQNLYEGRRKHVFVTVSSILCENLKAECINLNAPKKFRVITWKELVKFKRGILFLTYMDLRENYDDIIKLVKSSFDGIIAFDECHMARSFSKNGITGKCVVRMQMDLPRSRVIYSSATALSSPENIAYLTRLGLWGEGTSFADSKSFVDNLKKRGISGMELMACDLNKKGAFISRQLSQEGVTSLIKVCETDEKIELLYKTSVEMWMLIIKYAKKHRKSRMMSVIWRAHQTYFAALCVSSKVPKCIEETRQAVNSGKQVIIGIQTTGESLFDPSEKKARVEENSKTLYRASELKETSEHSDDNSEDSDESSEESEESSEDGESSEEGEDSSEDGEESSEDSSKAFSTCSTDSDAKLAKGSMEERLTLIEAFTRLEPYLPRNSLDFLILELGGENMVAELTGRITKEKRVVDPSGKIYYTAVKRKSNEENVEGVYEKRQFQDSTKKIAIISNVASIGISLHADKLLKNADGEKVSSRFHITLEFPWSADRLVQQLGRSHRANQVSPPEYLFLITDIPGELRIVGTLATRVSHLGALTQGDRRSTVPILDDYSFKANEILAVTILKNLLECLSYENEKLFKKMIKIGIFKEENGAIKLGNCSRNLEGFFNRILGLNIKDQRRIYKTFLSSREMAINQTPQDIDIHLCGDSSKIFSMESNPLTTGIFHHVIVVDPRMSLEAANNIRNTSQDYTFLKNRTSGKVFLAISENSSFRLYTPENGKRDLINEFIMKLSYYKIPIPEGEKLWHRQYDEHRVHMMTYNILAGDVLAVWTYLEKGLHVKRIQRIRAKLSNGNGIYGLLVPNDLINKAKILLLSKK